MCQSAPAVLLLAMLAACIARPSADEGTLDQGQPVSAFAALQTRGQLAMGVDQYTSTHRFDALSDGGRIELQRNEDDPAGVEQIREHLQGIAGAFTVGDFSTPAFVHLREMPGAAVMARKKGMITYTFSPLARGGQIRITTADPEARQAIHQFMAAQRGDHRARGHAH